MATQERSTKVVPLQLWAFYTLPQRLLRCLTCGGRSMQLDSGLTRLPAPGAAACAGAASPVPRHGRLAEMQRKAQPHVTRIDAAQRGAILLPGGGGKGREGDAACSMQLQALHLAAAAAAAKRWRRPSARGRRAASRRGAGGGVAVRAAAAAADLVRHAGGCWPAAAALRVPRAAAAAGRGASVPGHGQRAC